MTHYTHADLDMVDRHVAEGEQHIVRQEVLLTFLSVQGHPTDMAEALLKILNAAQVEHHLHRDAIAAALDEKAAKANRAVIGSTGV